MNSEYDFRIIDPQTDLVGYQPTSAEDYIKLPVMLNAIQEDRMQKLADQTDLLSVVGQQLNPELDKEVYDEYLNLDNSIRNSADELARNGLNGAVTMQDILNQRRLVNKFNSRLTPLLAFRAEQAKEQQTKMNEDPSFRFYRMADQTPIGMYMRHPNYEYKGISMNNELKKSSEIFKNFKETLTRLIPKSETINDTEILSYIQQNGWDSDMLFNWLVNEKNIDKNKANVLINDIKNAADIAINNLIYSTGIQNLVEGYDYLRPDDRAKILDDLLSNTILGSFSALGKSQLHDMTHAAGNRRGSGSGSGDGSEYIQPLAGEKYIGVDMDPKKVELKSNENVSDAQNSQDVANAYIDNGGDYMSNDMQKVYNEMLEISTGRDNKDRSLQQLNKRKGMSTTEGHNYYDNNIELQKILESEDYYEDIIFEYANKEYKKQQNDYGYSDDNDLIRITKDNIKELKKINRNRLNVNDIFNDITWRPLSLFSSPTSYSNMVIKQEDLDSIIDEINNSDIGMKEKKEILNNLKYAMIVRWGETPVSKRGTGNRAMIPTVELRPVGDYVDKRNEYLRLKAEADKGVMKYISNDEDDAKTEYSEMSREDQEKLKWRYYKEKKNMSLNTSSASLYSDNGDKGYKNKVFDGLKQSLLADDAMSELEVVSNNSDTSYVLGDIDKNTNRYKNQESKRSIKIMLNDESIIKQIGFKDDSGFFINCTNSQGDVFRIYPHSKDLKTMNDAYVSVKEGLLNFDALNDENRTDVSTTDMSEIRKIEKGDERKLMNGEDESGFVNIGTDTFPIYKKQYILPNRMVINAILYPCGSTYKRAILPETALLGNGNEVDRILTSVQDVALTFAGEYYSSNDITKMKAIRTYLDKVEDTPNL